jgi:hypothetical protein
MTTSKRYRRFTKVHIIDIAKCIRNTNISSNARLMVARNIANYFATIEQFMDRGQFIQIASGQVEDDPKTQAHSLYSEN